MTPPEPALIDSLLRQAGLGPARRVVPLTGGRNNRVSRIEHGTGDVLMKAYFRHPDDSRDRLGAEFAFARFARAAGLQSIPEPLASDPMNGLGLFEYVDGRAVEPGDVTDALIDECVEFVQSLNAARWRPAASRLPVASEACFSIEEQLATVGRRVERLRTIEPSQAIDREAIEFIERELAPEWEAIAADARAAVRELGLASDQLLSELDRCVSPSDFGFHNALLEKAGCIRFLDFEYAGWDDPAKLVCDFFCQPRVPAPMRNFASFAERVAQGFPRPEVVLARTRLLLPVYRVKWVCIRLNEFLNIGRRRREFSRDREGEDRKAEQLAGARAALAAIYESSDKRAVG
jgi:hypothetical protein